MIVIGFVFIVAGLALRVSPVRIPQKTIYDVSYGGGRITSLGYWGNGETVPVTIIVSDGDAQVKFYIYDPTGTEVYQGTTTTSMNYEFTTENVGLYKLHFEILESEDAKTVTIMKQLMWSQGPDITLIVAGIIIVFVAWTDLLKFIFPE
jgi:hypothetical protein